MELDRAIALYMNDCRARQLCPKTMLSYEQALKLFAVWLVDTFGMTAIGKITADHIRQYIIDLQERGKYTFCINSSSCAFNHPQNRRDYREKISNCTINNYLRNMHAFFSWLVEQEYLPRSPMQKIKALPEERRAKEFLDDDEVIRILKIMDKSYFPEMRDYSAMMLMLDSGTRLGETLSAKVTQLDLQEKSLHLPADKTKGRKARTVFFPAKPHVKYGIGCNSRIGIVNQIICSQLKQQAIPFKSLTMKKISENTANVRGSKSKPPLIRCGTTSPSVAC